MVFLTLGKEISNSETQYLLLEKILHKVTLLNQVFIKAIILDLTKFMGLMEKLPKPKLISQKLVFIVIKPEIKLN